MLLNWSRSEEAYNRLKQLYDKVKLQKSATLQICDYQLHRFFHGLEELVKFKLVKRHLYADTFPDFTCLLLLTVFVYEDDTFLTIDSLILENASFTIAETFIETTLTSAIQEHGKGDYCTPCCIFSNDATKFDIFTNFYSQRMGPEAYLRCHYDVECLAMVRRYPYSEEEIQSNSSHLKERFEILKLQPEDAKFISDSWMFSDGEASELYFWRSFKETLGGLYISEKATGRKVGWIVNQLEGTAGALHIVEDCRGMGLAKWIIQTYTNRLIYDMGRACLIEIQVQNSASFKLFESCGFHRVNSGSSIDNKVTYIRIHNQEMQKGKKDLGRLKNKKQLLFDT